MVHFKSCSSSSVDRGWAWVILFGSTVEYFITIGMFKTFGIFFVEYQRKYSTTSSMISLVLTVQTIVGSVSSLLIMGVGMRYFGKRPLIMVAALFGLCSNIGNAFAAHPFFLFFSQSTLYAFTVSCAHLPCTILLGEYFKKRRGLANAVANLGASIGGLAWPPLVVFLIAASALPITFIPPFAADRGLEMSSLGYLVTIAGASDIFGNIVFIFISDNKKVQRYHIFSIAMTVNGVLFLFASFYTNFMSLAIFGILHTVLGGAYFCLINVLVVDFIGLNNIKYGVVIASVTKDVSVAITSALVGMIRDITGSYVGGFYLLGTCSIVGGLLLLVKPFVSVQN